MSQASGGVAPSPASEKTIMTVWPSNAAYALGRFHGRLYSIAHGFYIFTVGNLFCLLSIPGSLALYFWRLLPGVGKRYTLTNRRVLECRSEIRRETTRLLGIPWPFRFRDPVITKHVGLEDFDGIDVEALPGQEWYDAADLVFRCDGDEVFRLEGVSRPEAFRQCCLKARLAYVSVKQALQREAASLC